jgi:hypothetical protein
MARPRFEPRGWALRPTGRLIISCGGVGAASRIKGETRQSELHRSRLDCRRDAGGGGRSRPRAAQARASPCGEEQTVKRAQSQSSGLADIPFSNPYAPPVGARENAGEEFPAAQRAAPTDPKGNLSLTYKWKASNDPVDPYWDMRSAPGSEAPGDSFLGGVKLGF